MKILQVCQSFYPCLASGGVVRVVYEISKEFVNHGDHVTVYTTDGCDGLIGNNRISQDIYGIKVYYFKNMFKILKSRFKITNPYYMFWIARKDIKNFEVIHVHEHRTILAVIIHHYSKKYGIPYIIQAHGSIGYFSKSLFKKLFDRLWGFNILHDANKAIALNETEFEEYCKMGISPDKIAIIPNGINLDDFRKLPQKGEFKRKFHIRDNEKVILYLGRLNKSKGIDILIKQFNKITMDIKNVKLVIAGPDDGFLNDLEVLTDELDLTDEILFTGPLYTSDKLEAYIDADVFVTPHFSGFPITFLESCACGTPIVTTDKADKLEWIQDVGFIANDENIVQCIIKILFDDDLSHKFSENGKNLVQEKFNWHILSNKLEELYKNI
ncbi:D-inositol-3-phosphate glycosyltransferase [anaerobic digester metagenome]|jgi:glycosyltransferase involved in cell wall biosynthesis